MDTITPISPHEEQQLDNHNHTQQQPPITSSPPSPIEYTHHHQDDFTHSIPPSPPPPQPDTSPHRHQPPPEHVQLQPQSPVPPSPEQPTPPPSPPSQPPPSPPPTQTEQPNQLTSPSPPPPIEPEDPIETPNPTSDHESPISNPNPNPNLEPNPSPSPKPNQSPKDLSPSPPLTTGSPSSPAAVTPPLGVPLLLHAAAGSSQKPQISPWTPQETANLIQAYQEKWYSLKKGPLKAGQWEEVAITVAARCGYDEQTKTSKQCRHKLEKLRKRYRAERGKPRSKALAWNFFKLMDDLEKGPLPISSSPPVPLVEYQKPSKKRKLEDENDDDGDGDDEYVVNKRSGRAKSHNHYNHHVPNGYLARDLRFADGGSRVVRGLRTPVVHKHKGFYQEVDEEEEEEEGGDNGGEEEGVAAQLAVEIKGFAEKFVKMENKKIEMIRDVERYRLEMENKRMEMILESQQMLIETVNKAFSFSSSHKTHKLSAK